MALNVRALRQLAGLYGVQTAYYDTTGCRQVAEPESLLLVCRFLGAPVETFDDVPAALRLRQRMLWQRGLEPVVVAWEGKSRSIDLRLPAQQATGPMACRLQMETGEEHHWEEDVASLPTSQMADVDGTTYLIKQVPIPVVLPWGYHHLRLHIAGQPVETRLISAPLRSYTPPSETTQREWGVFLPLYALHSAQSWGSGDFSDLEALAAWVAELGGGVVATLPLLSAFLDEPYDPSPYIPASRLFWNEFYIDVSRAPGFQDCPAAQALLRSTAVQEALETLRATSRVDYRQHMRLKRQVLAALAQWFGTMPADQQGDFQAYVQTHPAVEDYARFRATGERQQVPWPQWPGPQRDGLLTEADYDAGTYDYHRYVQWVAHKQLTAAANRSRAVGVRLYLDVPLGVHPYSYDVWRARELFVTQVAAGAPPDAYFTKGQNWGFPPLHPDVIRAQGYQYWLTYLRHQCRHTGLLRLDHVMGLHRLFWIPQGLEARQGVYVRYAAEELYATLNVESHRHLVSIVGENLGTVPTYVNTAMARHDLYRMYVVQYELTPASQGVLRPVPRHAVAGLNTHDMPPFAAYWQGLDITDRAEQGLLSPAEAEREHQDRQELLLTLQGYLQHQGLLAATPTDVAAVLSACLAFLSTSSARVVLVNLEDLWLESQAQNFPGTGYERPNWQHKARYSLEVWRTMPQILATLRAVNHLRNQGSR